MAQIQDIPRLTREFIELARAYLIQETIEPAKKLGHFAGYSFGATALWSVALILLAVAGLRALYDALPDSPYWEGLAYLITVVVLVGFLALVASLVPDRSVHDSHSDADGGGTS
ncbi:MAG: hypothetical protein QNJ71_03205 [Acidimicrobiia bacterium]|nr:hypothetical protein [Acidimicrobiia bacterium]